MRSVSLRGCHDRLRSVPRTLAACVVVAALGACSGSGHQAGSSTTLSVPVTSTTTTTTTTVPSVTTSTPTGSTTTITTSARADSTTTATTTRLTQTLNCATADLSISVGGGQSGLGHFGYVILFDNKGPACFLHGYPELDGEDASGAIVEVADQTPSGNLGGLGSGVSEPTFVLETGQTASAFYEGLASSTQGVTCHPYTVLAITPPDETQSAQVLSPQPICQLQVHPVVPGNTGSDPQQP